MNVTVRNQKMKSSTLPSAAIMAPMNAAFAHVRRGRLGGTVSVAPIRLREGTKLLDADSKGPSVLYVTKFLR